MARDCIIKMSYFKRVKLGSDSSGMWGESDKGINFGLEVICERAEAVFLHWLDLFIMARICRVAHGCPGSMAADIWRPESDKYRQAYFL